MFHRIYICFINSRTAKETRFPAPGLAPHRIGFGAKASGKARESGSLTALRKIRRPILPYSFTSLATSAASPLLTWVCASPLAIHRRSSSLDLAQSTSADSWGTGSMASQPALSHPGFGVNGRSAPSHSISRGFTALLQPSAGAKCKPRLVRLSSSTIIPSPLSPIIV